MRKKEFTFIDLFAGIGGFRIGLEDIGGKCVAFSEIESKAIQTYLSNWSTDSLDDNLGDITTVEELPDHDLLVGGVPCQPWSIAGKNKGYDDKRGQLWDNVLNLISTSCPKAFILENVKGLVDPRHRDRLDDILMTLQNSGYDMHYKLINSFDYGVPQNRDRVFIVGIKKGSSKKLFSWPKYILNHVRLFEVFDGIESSNKKNRPFEIERDLYGERVSTNFNKLTPKDQKNSFFILTDIRNGPTSVHSWDIKTTTKREKNICMTILKNRRKPCYGPCDGNPMRYEDLSDIIPNLKERELQKLVTKQILRQYEEDGRYEFRNRRLSGGIDGVYRVFMPESVFFPTITATGSKDMVATISVDGVTNEEYKSNFIEKILKPKMFRPISDKEALLVQGYPKKYKLIHSEAINKRLLGNSVAVPVIRAIGASIIKTGIFN